MTQNSVVKYYHREDSPRGHRTFIAVFLVLVLALTMFAVKSFGKARVPEPVCVNVNAKSAIIIEAKSGKVLFEKNADHKLPPASMVKVMTAMVVMDRMPLHRRVIAGDSAIRVEPTIAGIRPGESYEVGDLIAAVLIKSANDAAVVLAEAVSGSEKRFVDLMNRKARALGMKNTRFTSASGLPSKSKKNKQYTTARDMARMMRYALRYKYIIETMAKTEDTIYGSDNVRLYLKTHNRSLFSKNGASWGKTGYTMEARRTFVGIDPSMKPKIVFSLLKSDDLWNDISTLKNKGLTIYNKRHKKLSFKKPFKWRKRR